MKKVFIILMIISFLMLSCNTEGIDRRISNLQEKVDQITKKLEGGEGLKAKEGLGDIEDIIKNLQESINNIEDDIDRMNKKIDELANRIKKIETK